MILMYRSGVADIPLDVYLFVTFEKEKINKSYFFVIRNLKKKRRAIAPRLKKVHWFVPKYLYFNFYTLRCLVIKQTSSKDVHFAFKSSLKKLYIFYKSLSF